MNGEKNSFGVTLVEITILIGVLALLGVLILVSVDPASFNARSRDTQRIADLASLSQAVESYILDQGQPPDLQYTTRQSTQSAFGHFPAAADGNGWIRVNMAKYNDKLPVDPFNKVMDGKQFFYRYRHDGAKYKFDAQLEHYSDYAQNDGGTDPNRYEQGNGLTAITF